MRYSTFGLMVLMLANGSVAMASPTVKGLKASNTTDSSVVYTDTSNANALWVTPPTEGNLNVVQRSYAVDKATCESVAALNRSRKSQLVQLAEYDSQIESILQDINAVRSAIVSDASEDLTDRLDALLNLLKTMTDLRDDQGARLGTSNVPPHLLSGAGFYSYTADSGWDDALKMIRDSNTGFSVNPIQTRNAVLNISVQRSAQGDDIGFFPNEMIADVKIGNTDDITAVTNTFQIDVEPTKIGACFLEFPNIVEGTAEEFAFAVSIDYEHPLALSTTVSASYNLLDVYELIRESGKSGGLFSSKSYSRTIESRELTEKFNLVMVFEQDVTQEDIILEENRVKEFLLGYAVSQLTAQAGVAPAPGKTGAAIASEEIAKACGSTDPYCAGIAAGFKILDGIFGKSKSIQTLRRTLDVTKTYNSSATETVFVPGTISFVVK